MTLTHMYDKALIQLGIRADDMEARTSAKGEIVEIMEELGADYDDAWFYAINPQSARDIIDDEKTNSVTREDATAGDAEDILRMLNSGEKLSVRQKNILISSGKAEKKVFIDSEGVDWDEVVITGTSRII